MSKEMLDSLIAGTLPDPDGEGMLSVPLKTIVIGGKPTDRLALQDFWKRVDAGEFKP